MQALYPNVILTNKEARIYKQTYSLATTRIVTSIDYIKHHEDEEVPTKCLFKEQNIRDYGVEFIRKHNHGTQRSDYFYVKMEGGNTQQIVNVLKRRERALILTRWHLYLPQRPRHDETTTCLFQDL